jgi:ABC-2 type transport system permease protein
MTQTLAAEITQSEPKARRLGPALAAGDCAVLVGRDLRHLIRNPEQLIQAFSLPVILLLLFRYLLGGAINTDGMSYINYVIAGLFVITAAFNSTTTVVGVTDDLGNGIVERFSSMPMFVPAVLIGHVISSVLRSFLSIAVMILVGLGIGFRPHASVVAWIGALAMLLLFITTLSWLAVILGTTVSTAEGASGISMILVFLPYASSALVPVSTMPSGLREVIRYQPFSPVIDTVRALLTGTPVGNSGWIAIVWWAAILVVAVPFSISVFRRRAARRS